ncbi:hypothetical protein Gogos_012000 [Gossypium gossypioides]|uniref:Uncharacterized protein n=1 Tax=Gossypium gossypioides TaxID=34282 RepID=A0A7J9BR73_GOSGO|nr:hypothetical protein [Gossypium gossypioides]
MTCCRGNPLPSGWNFHNMGILPYQRVI